MKRYEYDPETSDGWKSYPVRIVVSGKSRCCGQQTILVKSMRCQIYIWLSDLLQHYSDIFEG